MLSWDEFEAEENTFALSAVIKSVFEARYIPQKPKVGRLHSAFEVLPSAAVLLSEYV